MFTLTCDSRTLSLVKIILFQYFISSVIVLYFYRHKAYDYNCQSKGLLLGASLHHQHILGKTKNYLLFLMFLE